jgi:hypothetical protein
MTMVFLMKYSAKTAVGTNREELYARQLLFQLSTNKKIVYGLRQTIMINFSNFSNNIQNTGGHKMLISRPMVTIGQAATSLGLFGEYKMIIGITLSATGKSVFYDRANPS